MDYKKLLETKPYDFLFKNEHLGNNIILLGLGGSHAYGTNVATSDVDIRGVAIEKPEDIIGLQTFEQFNNDETDTVIYSFNKICKLLADCNPNIIEILGLDDDQYIYKSKLGEELLKNKDMFLSKRIYFTFGGYAKANLKKLENALARDNYPEEVKNRHIKLSLDNAIADFNSKHQDQGKDCFARVDENGKLVYTINVKDIDSDSLSDLYATISNTTRNYNCLQHRNRKKDDNHLNKHAMHLVRLLLMSIEMLETGEIHTKRIKDHDLLMKIRNGYYMNEDGNMSNDFYKLVDELSERHDKAYAETKLPNRADFKKIQEFIVTVNKNIINGVYKDEIFKI